MNRHSEVRDALAPQPVVWIPQGHKRDTDGADSMARSVVRQAIQMASECRIALILMDVQMPGMNGVDAFMEIKKILPDCPVVIMTGAAVGSLIEKALSEGVKTVLSKPLSIERLLGIVEEVVPA